MKMVDGFHIRLTVIIIYHKCQHGPQSALIAARYIRLKEIEEQAICWHMGHLTNRFKKIKLWVMQYVKII